MFPCINLSTASKLYGAARYSCGNQTGVIAVRHLLNIRCDFPSMDAVVLSVYPQWEESRSIPGSPDATRSRRTGDRTRLISQHWQRLIIRILPFLGLMQVKINVGLGKSYLVDWPVRLDCATQLRFKVRQAFQGSAPRGSQYGLPLEQVRLLEISYPGS